MEGFRYFFEQTKEQEANIKATLKKLPSSHQELIAHYDIKWQCDNTLDGDDKHIGIINPNNKTITIASPWNYGREYTFLHEIGHKIWEAFVLPHPTLVKQWKQIVKKTKNKMNQNAEELFAMGYANFYAKNKIVIHTHTEWEKFIKNLPK